MSRTATAQIDTSLKSFVTDMVSTSKSDVALAMAIANTYHAEWGRIVAILIRLVGDFDLAEEAAQEAFAAAVNQWQTGIPDRPRAWLIRTARYKAIDRLRRRTRLTEKLEWYAASGLILSSEEPTYNSDEIPDDRLRLIFTCCHPALATETQVALTLRMLGGLETDEIARAFLVPTATMAQRLVRVKRKIRDAGIPYEAVEPECMPCKRRSWHFTVRRPTPKKQTGHKLPGSILIDQLAPELDSYHLFHATRNDSERRFLEHRLHEVSQSMSRS